MCMILFCLKNGNEKTTSLSEPYQKEGGFLLEQKIGGKRAKAACRCRFSLSPPPYKKPKGISGEKSESSTFLFWFRRRRHPCFLFSLSPFLRSFPLPSLPNRSCQNQKTKKTHHHHRFLHGAGGVSVLQSPLIGTPPLTPLRQNWMVVLALGGSDLEKNGEKRNSVDSPAKTAPTPVAV